MHLPTLQASWSKNVVIVVVVAVVVRSYIVETK